MKLNEPGYAHARRLVEDSRAVLDERDAWSEHQPTSAEQNEYIAQHGWGAYRRWFLGIKEDEDEESKERYAFPYGDFEQVHRCAVLSAEVRAAQFGYQEIEVAAAHLHGVLDRLREKQAAASGASRR